MHNNYFFLRQLAHYLNAELSGCMLEEAFSQSREELILQFNGDQEFYIQAIQRADFSCLRFSQDLSKARKNVVSLFQSATDEKVENIRVAENDRLLIISLSNHKKILLKLYGTRSNVLLVEEGRISSVFKSKLVRDVEIDPDNLDRELDLSKERFFDQEGNIKKFEPTFGPIPLHYLEKFDYSEKNLEQKWLLYQDVRSILLSPNNYYLTHIEDEPFLTLLPVGEIEQKFTDPISAVEAYFRAYFFEYLLQRQKDLQQNEIHRQIKKYRKSLSKAEHHLQALQLETPPNQVADIIMANLHELKKGESAELENFYTGEKIRIKLKNGESPQKHAERLYQKSKNRNIEIDQVKSKISELQARIEKLKLYGGQIANADSYKELRKLESKENPTPHDEKTLPYREVQLDGYRILIGKSARSNDELLRQHSQKDDLWLHAKDCAGSHVIIKKEGKNNIPSYIKERAAELAAYHSKKRTESLAPVSITPRKYVRKFKGGAPGQVFLEKEDVIMAKPTP